MSTEFYNRNWRMPNSWNGSTDNNSKVSNYSMSFDGSSEYIDCGTDIGNFFGENYTGEMAISIWFKADTTSSDDGIFIFTGASALGEISAYIYLGDLEVRVRGVVVATGVFTDTSNWHNLIINLFGPSGANQVYLDGVAFDSTFTYTSGGLDFNGETFEIGHYGGTRYFSGKLDHCSIFDYALSAQQILDLQGSSSTGVGNSMSLSAKPKFYYPIGDYAAFNGSEYLVNNGALSDYNFALNPGGYQNQSIALNQAFSYPNGFTISFWVKFTGAIYGTYLFDNRDSTSTQRVYVYIGYNSMLNFGVNNRVVWSRGAPPENASFVSNKWYHIAAVYDPNATFINGRQAANFGRLVINGPNPSTGNSINFIYNSTASGAISPALNLTDTNARIGASSLNPISGESLAQYSNFAIFDTPLPNTGAQSITSLYNNGTPPDLSTYSNLEAWWKLDASATFDSSTSTWSIPDDSSNSNTGTSNNMTAANLVQSDLLITQPYSRYALSFDGTDDYIVCSNFDSLAGLNTFSVSFWANFNNVADNDTVLLHYSVLGIRADLQNSKMTFRWSSSDSTVVLVQSTTYPIATGTWTHYACTYDNTDFKLYENGALINTTNEPSKTYRTNLNETLFMGKYAFGVSRLLDGLLSNVSFWNTGLSQAQITELYNSGKPSNLNNHSAYSNLINWWQLGENSSFNTNWTVLDEKGTNNGTSANMGEEAIVNGVGTSGNGLSDGMGGADNIIGDAPYSTANAVSYGMGIDARNTDVPS